MDREQSSKLHYNAHNHTIIHTFLAQLSGAIMGREQSSKPHYNSHMHPHFPCAGDGRYRGAGAVKQAAL